MTREEFIILAEKVADGRASVSEIALYNASYESFQQDPINLAADGLDANVLKKESLVRFWKSNDGPKRVVKLWPRIAAVPAIWKIAAAVAAITLGVWLFYASGLLGGRHAEFISASPLANDIAPGRNTATITFDDGEAVGLNDKELDLSYTTVEPLKEGSEVAPEKPQFLASRIAKSKIVVLSTPRGGQYQVVLPDGTKVWLNADSKLSFPSQFSGRERKVLLEGEAYFAVVHNAKQPFRVESRGQVVEDIGTEFNINAYADENDVKTTLVEGEARVFSLSSRATAKDLKPNQQAILKGEAIQVKQVDPSEAVAWKNGYFQFDTENLESVMNKLARWYDVEVQYENAAAKQLKFSGTMSRYDHISQVLKKIQAVSALQYSIRGKTVILK